MVFIIYPALIFDFLLVRAKRKKKVVEEREEMKKKGKKKQMSPLVRCSLTTLSKYELNHLICLELFQALIWKMCGRLGQKKCNRVPSLLRRMCARRSESCIAKLGPFLKAQSHGDGDVHAG